MPERRAAAACVNFHIFSDLTEYWRFDEDCLIVTTEIFIFFKLRREACPAGGAAVTSLFSGHYSVNKSEWRKASMHVREQSKRLLFQGDHMVCAYLWLTQCVYGAAISAIEYFIHSFIVVSWNDVDGDRFWISGNGTLSLFQFWPFMRFDFGGSKPHSASRVGPSETKKRVEWLPGTPPPFLAVKLGNKACRLLVNYISRKSTVFWDDVPLS